MNKENRYQFLKEFAICVMDLVNEQAEDHGIWFQAKTAPEAYLQQELRKLHKKIEDELPKFLNI